ncbi:MAG: hypothetical protein P4L54_03260 [Acidocella sp.]|nr:hypothetical protein [Acidocella sp.]
MTKDFIYDPENGTCIATIDNNKVFRETDGLHVATIQNGNIIGLKGKVIGHLTLAGSDQKSTLSAVFRKLLLEKVKS